MEVKVFTIGAIFDFILFSCSFQKHEVTTIKFQLYMTFQYVRDTSFTAVLIFMIS